MILGFKFPPFDFSQFYSIGLNLLYAFIILIVGLRTIKSLIKWLNKRFEKSKIDTSLKSFLSPLISMLLKISLIIAIISILGIPTTSFVALLGSIGFAIGLAFQGSLANFAGGVLILIFKPYKIGDFIEAQNYNGTVKDIHIFYTTLVTPDNKKVIIPNSNLSNANLINYSTYPTRRIELNLSCSYDNDIKKVKETLETMISQHPSILKEPKTVVYLSEYADSSIRFIVRGWVGAADYWDTYYDLMYQVKERFDKNNITIPYPQIDVHMVDKKS